MRALVTGANGFIGSHMCELLKARGHAVRGLVRRTSDLTWIQDLGIELAYGDIREQESLASAVAGVDWVFHTAAAVRPKDARDYERVNCDGTQALAGESEKAGVKRFVLFSSVAAGGPAESPEAPRRESDAPLPMSRYGRGKLRAELAVIEMKDKLHSVVLRFPAVYGPRDRDSLLLLRSLKRGFAPVFGRTFSAVHVADAVKAALLAVEADVASGSVYYVSDGRCYCQDEMLEIAERQLGRRALRIRIPAWALRFAGRVSEWLSCEGSIFNRDKARELVQECWVCGADKARAELGFEPQYGLEAGLAETVEWYKERKWL